MSGGACFSPRLNPRPKPLRNIDVLRDVVVKNIRSPMLAAAICKLLFPVYMAIVNWWQSYQLSDRFFLVSEIIEHTWFSDSLLLFCVLKINVSPTVPCHLNNIKDGVRAMDDIGVCRPIDPASSQINVEMHLTLPIRSHRQWSFMEWCTWEWISFSCTGTAMASSNSTSFTALR